MVENWVTFENESLVLSFELGAFDASLFEFENGGAVGDSDFKLFPVRLANHKFKLSHIFWKVFNCNLITKNIKLSFYTLKLKVDANHFFFLFLLLWRI
jgi:hypothetical protein